MNRNTSFHPSPSRPALALPPGACDAHVHVFGPADRFPYANETAYQPPDAPKEKLFALHRHLGITRCVIVQSAVHGYDNSVVLDAIAAGQGRYLGVALVRLEVGNGELARLAQAGIRGVRFNFMSHLPFAADIAQVMNFTRRLAPLGMHLQLHFESSLIHRIAPALADSAVPVVIDHMARIDAGEGAEHADFRALRALLRHPDRYVKISGSDRISRDPSYADGALLARLLAQEFPEKCFWGTDWPHPNHTHAPDDGALVDLLSSIAPEPELLEQILVRNPMSFYRFDS